MTCLYHSHATKDSQDSWVLSWLKRYALTSLTKFEQLSFHAGQQTAKREFSSDTKGKDKLELMFDKEQNLSDVDKLSQVIILLALSFRAVTHNAHYGWADTTVVSEELKVSATPRMPGDLLGFWKLFPGSWKTLWKINFGISAWKTPWIWLMRNEISRKNGWKSYKNVPLHTLWLNKIDVKFPILGYWIFFFIPLKTSGISWSTGSTYLKDVYQLVLPWCYITPACLKIHCNQTINM